MSKSPKKKMKISPKKLIKKSKEESVNLEIEIIEFVKEHPVIYDTSIDSYKNSTVKDNLWSIFCENNNISLKEAKDKWNSLRSGFRQAFKRSSGDGRSKKWQHLDRLMFLKDSNLRVTDSKEIPTHKEGNFDSKSNDKIDDNSYNKTNDNSDEDLENPDEYIDGKEIRKRSQNYSEFNYLEDASINSKITERSKSTYSERSTKKENKDKNLVSEISKILSQPDNNESGKFQNKYLEEVDCPVMCFFRSIKLDVKKMNEKQFRKFKRDVIDKIDEILDDN